MRTASKKTLLTAADPDPVEVINPDSPCPILLLCEHAGQAIPMALNGLGVTRAVLDSHRGWDIGAETVARRLAARLGAPLIIQRYSRLVLDANRPPHSVDAFVTESDGVLIPGNKELTATDRTARIDEIFTPLDETISYLFNRHPRRFASSVHSFTPHFAGRARPWHAGFLTRDWPDTARQIMASIQAEALDAVMALNEPYQIDDASDWFIPVHAEPRNIPHCLIEIRNDLIDTDQGAELWADRLDTAIKTVLESLS